MRLDFTDKTLGMQGEKQRGEDIRWLWIKVLEIQTSIAEMFCQDSSKSRAMMKNHAGKTKRRFPESFFRSGQLSLQLTQRDTQDPGGLPAVAAGGV